MVNGTIVRRYAEGMLLVAKDQDTVEQLSNELAKLTTILQENQELLNVVEHPLIHADVKMNILKGVFGESLSASVYHLLGLLFRRKRAEYIVPIAERYQLFAQAERGEITVEIETTKSLTDEEIAAWQTRLGQTTGKKIIPIVKINQQLIAGYRVKLGDRVLDATLSGALRQFDQKLKAAGAF